MDPISKAAIAPVLPKTEGIGGLSSGSTPAETGFQDIQKNGQQAGETGTAVSLPPEIMEVSPAERKTLESGLRRKLERTDAANPQEFFRAEMEQTKVQLERLHKQVDAIPKQSGGGPLTDRLSSLENKYQESEKMLSGMNNLDSPRDLLKMQMQIYSMTQNIELVSKTVESVSGGVKQILQTQV